MTEPREIADTGREVVRRPVPLAHPTDANSRGAIPSSHALVDGDVAVFVDSGAPGPTAPWRPCPSRAAVVLTARCHQRAALAPTGASSGAEVWRAGRRERRRRGPDRRYGEGDTAAGGLGRGAHAGTGVAALLPFLRQRETQGVLFCSDPHCHEGGGVLRFIPARSITRTPAETRTQRRAAPRTSFLYPLLRSRRRPCSTIPKQALARGCSESPVS